MNKDPSVVGSMLWIQGLRWTDQEYIYDILSDVGYTDSFIADVIRWLFLQANPDFTID